jgi:pyruvate,water dikinase
MGDFEYVKLFSELGLADVPLVGGKNASLGEMFRELTDEKIRVPGRLRNSVRRLLRLPRPQRPAPENHRRPGRVSTPRDVSSWRDRRDIRGWIVDGEMPPKIAAEIRAAYDRLRRDNHGRDPEVAVRSSATAEDLPDASFAGQQETYLNVCGERTPAAHLQARLASLFTTAPSPIACTRASSTWPIALSAGVQRMVRSDLAASGVMFSIDTESGFPDVVMVTASLRPGEKTWSRAP